MRSVIQAILVMLVLASTVTLSQQAPNRQINKLKVAVANFDLVGTTASTYAAWGQSFAESFQTQIVQSGRFEVYDRQQTSKLLGEVNFSQSGLTADGARKLKAQSINYLITGTITRLSNQRIQITFKIIDVETAKVEFQDEAYGKDDADFQQIATRFVGGLAKRYPLKGNILGEVGPSGQYYIDLGSASNVTEEATGQIFEITTQGGRTILVPKANFRVLKVINQDTAIIQVQAAGRDAYIPKANDTIQFDVATPVGPVSVPAALKGTLVIRLTNADVTGATVIINGVTQDRQLRSNQPLELSVESIPQSIIIRAPGFQDGVRNDIEVKGGSTTSVEITLLRLTSTVRVGSLPVGAKVFANGREQSSPVFDLPPGKVSLEVRAPGYETFRQDITLAAGQGFDFNPNLRPVPGVLVVRSNVPNATVSINDKPRGTISGGGLELKNLGSEEVRVTVQAPGYESETRTIKLEPGKRLVEQFVLKPLATSFIVRSSTEGAEVRVDGQGSGVIRNGQLELKLKPGSHEIVLTANGFIENRRTVLVQVGKPGSLSLNLRRALASISITSEPSGATVRLNGRMVGRTPFTGTVEPGNYDVTFELSGFEEVKTKLNASTESPSNLVVNMKATIGTLVLVINPATATATVNDKKIPSTEQARGIRLAPGKYIVEVTAAGYETQQVTVVISAGSTTQEAIKLKPLNPTPTAVAPPTTPATTPVTPPTTPATIAPATPATPPAAPTETKPAATATPSRSSTDTRTIFVSSDVAATGSGTKPQPTNLRLALEKASKSTTITLLDGTYTIPDGGLTVPSGVSVVAENSGRVTLIGKSGTASINLGSNAILDGLAISKFDVGLRVVAGTVELRNVRFEGNRRALEVSGEAEVTLINPTINANSVGANVAAVAVTGKGKLTIRGGTFEGNASAAIRAADDATLNITGTTFKNNWITGTQIELGGQTKATITDTTFVGGRFSIRVTSGSVSGSACQLKRLSGALLPQLLDAGAKFQVNC